MGRILNLEGIEAHARDQYRRGLDFGLMALLAAGLVSMSETATAQTLTVCEQSANYQLKPAGPQVPADFQAFLGVWVGSWDFGLCGAFVVESVTSDGTVRLLYANGSLGGQYPIKAGNRRYTGKINGKTLNASNQAGSIELTLTGSSQLAGKFTTQSNRSNGTFKRQ